MRAVLATSDGLVQGETEPVTERQHIRGKFTQDPFIPMHVSSGKGRVVIGPDHGPRVDVEQGTVWSWLARLEHTSQVPSSHSHEYSPKPLS